MLYFSKVSKCSMCHRPATSLIVLPLHCAVNLTVLLCHFSTWHNHEHVCFLLFGIHNDTNPTKWFMQPLFHEIRQFTNEKPVCYMWECLITACSHINIVREVVECIISMQLSAIIAWTDCQKECWWFFIVTRACNFWCCWNQCCDDPLSWQHSTACTGLRHIISIRRSSILVPQGLKGHNSHRRLCPSDCEQTPRIHTCSMAGTDRSGVVTKFLEGFLLLRVCHFMVESPIYLCLPPPPMGCFSVTGTPPSLITTAVTHALNCQLQSVVQEDYLRRLLSGLRSH